MKYVKNLISERKDLNIFSFDFIRDVGFLKSILLKEKDDVSIINEDLLVLDLSSENSGINEKNDRNKKSNQRKKE